MLRFKVDAGTRVFLTVWFGQLVSIIGSGLTGFSVSVWIYQSTGSATKYSLMLLSTAVPAILLSPFIGALVDRLDRRRIMIISNIGCALCTMTIALLFFFGIAELWALYIILGVNSACNTFLVSAYSASIALLIPKAQFGRAQGLIQFGSAAAGISSPLLAGALISIINIYGVMMIDFATFIVAITTMLMVTIPNPVAREEGRKMKKSLLREAAAGWTYISSSPGLLGLLVFFSISNFATSLANALFWPLILSFSTPTGLSTVAASSSIGMLAGSIMLTVWGGPKSKRRVPVILSYGLLQGLIYVVCGSLTSVALVAIANFTLSFYGPLVAGSSQVIWQSKTLPEVQGRVFAIRRLISWSSLPLAFALAGPLADKVFNPMLTDGGILASSIGSVIGIGPGRGIGLLYITIGVFIALVTLISCFYPRLTRLEEEIPDVIIEAAVTA
jgi:DHA3 family macrolide efflux protein-like MFS transporter